jgi:hypothetical protein
VSDLVVRREADGDISVLATATLDGKVAGGYARVRGVAFADAPASRYANLARGRAWQVLVRLWADDAARSFDAARRGVHVLPCTIDRWRGAVLHGDSLRETSPVEAREWMSKLLDETITSCVRQFHRRREMAKGRLAL